ncbi:MAG: hypothetical protein CM15mP23_07070 [Cryomorphaceae bacterium]|nr:MAG: hypothetical protein CM15mP23_07070 [Cryomorphaceae bacterium]
MSSRNLLLDKRYRAAAPRIYQRLLAIKDRAKNTSVTRLRSWIENVYKKDEDLVLEYFEIADADSLKKAKVGPTFPSILLVLLFMLAPLV